MFGGIGSACYDYALALSNEGIMTSVICGQSRRISKQKINDHLEVIRLPCLSMPPRFCWFQLQNLRLFESLLKSYSVVHIFNPQAGAAIALLNKKAKKPLVTSIHGLYLTSLKLSLSSIGDSTIKDLTYQVVGYPLQVALHRTCLKNSDHITVCNESTLTELKQTFKFVESNKVSVVYNGINFKHTDMIDSEESFDEPIIYCGRLYVAKGVMFFVKALEKLKDSGASFHAQIFGEGPLKQKLMATISRTRIKL